MLPALADFFSVSTDELLGYKLTRRKEEINDIKKEISCLSEVGMLEERIAFARNANSCFSADFEIKENPAVYQMSQGKIEEALVSLEKMCYHATEYDRSHG